MRQSLVIANWKMNGSRSANTALLAALCEGLNDDKNTETALEVAICPPHVYLAEVAEQLKGSKIQIGAQDLSPYTAGAHTGDVSAEMLKEVGSQWVLVGHSERRSDHRESSLLVAEKHQRAIEGELIPVLCVGESLEQREAGKTLEVVAEQVDAVLSAAKIPPALIIAYEPVWAIGTGKTASAEQAQEVHAFIRQRLADKVSQACAGSSRILYGGSVKPNNAEELFKQPDIDGGLIGGASLEAESFIAICRAAQSAPIKNT